MTIALWYHLRSGCYRALRHVAERVAPAQVVTTERVHGFFGSHVVAALVRLDIPKFLSYGRRTIDELATEIGCDPDRLRRLLVVAERFDLVDQSKGFWRSTRLLEVLQSDSGSMAAQARFICAPFHAPAWARLDRVILTGENAFRAVNGTSMWDWFQQHPDDAEDHSRLLDEVARYETPFIMGAYRFPSEGTICDVGGGTGGLLDSVLADRPLLRGSIVEMPHMIERAERYLHDSPRRDRITLVAADIFEKIDVVADVYVVKSVLHDWGDEEALALLRSIRKAAPNGSRVVIIDLCVDFSRPSMNTLLADLQVMCTCDQGKERTVDEVHDLLEAAGFVPTAASTTVTNLSVVEGVVIEEEGDDDLTSSMSN